jgi:hypothetical protein
LCETSFCLTKRNYCLSSVRVAECHRKRYEPFLAFERQSRRRESDCTLFWSLDRFCREGTVETLTHLQRLTGYGVSFKSFSEQYLDGAGCFARRSSASSQHWPVKSVCGCLSESKRGWRRQRLRAELGRDPRQIAKLIQMPMLFGECATKARATVRSLPSFVAASRMSIECA